MMKYIRLLITVLMFSSVISGQTILSLGRVTAGGSPPTNVQVPLNISAPLNNVKSISLQFSFDKSKVKFRHEASDAHSGISNFALSDISNLAVNENNGLISLSWFNTTGATISGKLFDLDFQYLSNFSEVKIVSATIKDLTGKKFILDLSNGSISQNTNPAIRLIYPNGGEYLEVIGSPTNITWTSIYISSVNLEYTTDNGTSWLSIVNAYDAKKDSYTWTIPGTINSTECKIRITDVEPAATSDISDAKFTINSTPVLSLITPIGGEELKVGGVKTIKWTHRNILNIKLEYTGNASLATPTWQSIAGTIPVEDSVYEWIIPNNLSTDCKVRIADLVNPTSIIDTSDSSFTIMNSPIKVKVDSVVQAHLKIIGKVCTKSSYTDRYWWWEELPVGHWKHEKAEVEKDGVTYRASDTLQVNGTVPVNVGWLTSLQYLEINIRFDPNILILDSVIPTNPDFESMNYSEKDGLIRIVWATNIPLDIHGKVFDLKFRYKNFDKPLEWIKSGWDYDDSPVSNPETPTATIDPRNFSELNIESVKAKNSINEFIDAGDWTDGSLAISNNPAVKLLTPAGGEVWEVNDGSEKILWSSRRVTNVNISYSTNSGSDWNSIINPTGASSGTYTWTLPNINSSNCLIKISDSDESSTYDVSSTVFTITNVKSINLISPNGGEKLKSGSTKNITWSSLNLSNIKLEYSTNNDTTWTQIAASEPAKNYQYAWIVPAVSSEECRVRISEVIDTLMFDKSTGLFSINNSKIKVKVPYIVSPAGSINVPINTEQLNGITYINLAVKYNSLAMELDKAICNTALSAGQFNFVNNTDVVRLVWFSTTPVDFSGDLFTIKFKNYTGIFSEFTFFSPNQIKDSFGKLVDIEWVNGNIGTTDVEDEEIPTKYTLKQNFPNPFNPRTTIRYEIPKETNVRITVYNAIGQKVATLVDENKLAGYYQIIWNAENCANGIYIYSITTADFTQTKKMILLK